MAQLRPQVRPKVLDVGAKLTKHRPHWTISADGCRKQRSKGVALERLLSSISGAAETSAKAPEGVRAMEVSWREIADRPAWRCSDRCAVFQGCPPCLYLTRMFEGVCICRPASIGRDGPIGPSHGAGVDRSWPSCENKGRIWAEFGPTSSFQRCWEMLDVFLDFGAICSRSVYACASVAEGAQERDGGSGQKGRQKRRACLSTPACWPPLPPRFGGHISRGSL